MLTYTRAWALANPERVQTLLLASVECPICLEPFGPELARYSPLGGNFPTTCCHAICEPCGLELVEQPHTQWKCPICRADLAQWLADEFYYLPPECVTRTEIRAFVTQAIAALGPGATPQTLELGQRILRHL